jgi:hypothetical protein
MNILIYFWKICFCNIIIITYTIISLEKNANYFINKDIKVINLFLMENN